MFSYNKQELLKKYEKYNLFELMYLLNKSGLSAILNKKVIIDTFVDNNLDLEFDDNTNEHKQHLSHHMFRVQGNNIKWKLQKIIRQTYNIVILTAGLQYYTSPLEDASVSSARVISHNNNKHIMEIHTGDIIKIGNKEYGIFMRLYQFLSQKNVCEDDDRYDTMCVIIEDFETYDQIEYTTQELIDLFENEDVTYIKSLQFDLLNAEKQKKVEIININ
jgi:hypothetical protein